MLQEGKFPWDLRRKFMAVRLAEHWNRVQADCGVSIVGELQNLTGKVHEQPGLTWSQFYFEQKVGRDDLKSLPAFIILLILRCEIGWQKYIQKYIHISNEATGKFQMKPQEVQEKNQSPSSSENRVYRSLELSEQLGICLSYLCSQYSVSQKSPTYVHMQIYGYVPSLNTWQAVCCLYTMALILLP